MDDPWMHDAHRSQGCCLVAKEESSKDKGRSIAILPWTSTSFCW
ncbi:hypothetical protein DAI22_09g035401 [Oryza sativa Japonica Group]|nr:hypothetical protein DAI22_09g035401 [Oryza sativa Japonica Group]